ncbi:ABC transporter substrate-binding protein [soil metagenome]
MLKRHSLAGAAVALALTCSACSSSSSAQPVTAAGADETGPITISLESYMPSLGAPGTTTLNGLISDFEKANPNITVNLVTDSSSASSALAAGYQREAATGTLPDVGQVTFDALRFAIDGLGAQPLDSLYGADAIAAEFGGDHPYSAPVTKLAVVGNHTYGVPWTLSTPVLFYNPTLFEKAGLDPAIPPATWADVAKDAAAIKAATGSDGLANGCVGQGGSGADWCLQAILGSNGGSVVNDDGSKTTFDSAANISAVTQMQQLVSEGSMVDLTLPQALQEFGSGKVAMILNSSALQTTLLSTIGANFTLKNGPLPGFVGKTVTPTNSGSTLMVFSKDTAKQQAAWKLIQFLTSPAAETAITTKIGYPPLRPDLVDDAAYLKPYATSQPLIAANLKQLSNITPWRSYPGNNFLQIETLFLDAVSKSVFQGEDVASSLKGAQSQAAGLVQ